MLKAAGLELMFYKYYFPPKVMKMWWMMFKFTTWKVYKRELWSYLKDSPYGKVFPSKLISKLEYMLLRRSYNNAFNSKGAWLFIWAKKVK